MNLAEHRPGRMRRLRRAAVPGIVALSLAAGGLIAASPAAAAPLDLVSDPAQYVNTLAGTGSGGGTVGETNDFPGPARPFGMVQFSPDTNGTAIAGAWNNSSRGPGYRYSDTAVRGFSMTHSSQGCQALGDFPILPSTWSNLTGTGANAPYQRRNLIDKSNEVGEVGYYKVLANDGTNNILSELAATTRGGTATFTFPVGTDPKVFLKVNQTNMTTYNSDVTVDPATGITLGRVTAGNFCSKGNRYTAYYALDFEQDWSGFGTWQEGGAAVAGRTSAASSNNADTGAYFTFPNGTTAVRARMAISYVSAENALLNLNTEIPTIDATTLGTVRADGRAAWNAILEKALVSEPIEGQSTRDLRTYYTAFYHSISHPSTFSDVDGRYPGFENTPVIHNVSERPGADGRTRVQYSMFSDWDTYRSQTQLVSILEPEIASDQAQSLVNAAEQMGSFPQWMFMNATTNQMTGDNVPPLLAATWAFGARDWDIDTALDILVDVAVGDKAGKWTGGTNTSFGNGGPMIQRPGAKIYNEFEYAPQVRDFRADHTIAGASYTQEYSIDDFSISQLAKARGRTDVEEEFLARSHYWQNLFNPTTSYVQPRDRNGKFQEGNPLANAPQTFGYWYTTNPDYFGQYGYDEGNAEQYLWLEPQNIAGLADALGGRAVAANRLDAFMTNGLNVGDDQPYMWAGNEVNFHVPWLYDYLGEPWRTSEVVDEMTQTLFGDTPDAAEPGNDDLGAQASWLFWAGAGIYPTTPGTSVLAVNVPMFDRMVLSYGDGKTLTINAPGAQAGRHHDTGTKSIGGMKVNGVATTKTWIDASALGDSTTIDYTVLTNSHNDWGTAEADAPPSWREGGAGIVVNVNPPASTSGAAGQPGANTLAGALNVQPGGTASGTLDVQRIESEAPNYTVSATFDQAGISLRDVGTRKFDSHGHGSVALKFDIDPYVPSDFHHAIVTVTAGDSTATFDVLLHVVKTGSLEEARNVVGTAYEDAIKGRFDQATSGNNVYDRAQLAELGLTPGSVHDVEGTDGTVTTFTWPNAPHGYNDTFNPWTTRSTSNAEVIPNHWTIKLDRPAERLNFIGAGTRTSAPEQGVAGAVDVRLSNGTSYRTETADLSFGDWLTPSTTGDAATGGLAPQFGNTKVAWLECRIPGPRYQATTWPVNVPACAPGPYVFATKPYTAPDGWKVVSVSYRNPNLGSTAIGTRIFAVGQDAPELAAGSASAAAGTELPVTGTGYAPGEDVTVTAGTAPEATTTLVADELGEIAGSLSIPATAEPGTYSLTATAISIPRPAESEVTVTAAAAHEPPKVTTKCLAGSAYVYVTVVNDTSAPVDISVTTPHGSKTFSAVGAGKSATVAFNSRQASIGAGAVTATRTAVGSGEVISTATVQYAALNCG